MKNKNILVIVGVAVVFLGVGYFFGTSSSLFAPTVSNVSTTTNSTDGDVEIVATTTDMVPVKVTVKPGNSSLTSYNIRIGQRVLINGVYVTPVKVSYDSRCPKDVQCIQAGSVDVGMLFESGKLSQNVIVTSGKPFLFAGKTITIVGVTPAKVSTKKILESEYRFSVSVKN